MKIVTRKGAVETVTEVPDVETGPEVIVGPGGSIDGHLELIGKKTFNGGENFCEFTELSGSGHYVIEAAIAFDPPEGAESGYDFLNIGINGDDTPSHYSSYNLWLGTSANPIVIVAGEKGSAGLCRLILNKATGLAAWTVYQSAIIESVATSMWEARSSGVYQTPIDGVTSLQFFSMSGWNFKEDSYITLYKVV